MYELKKNGKVFTSKFVGTGSSSYEKRIYRSAVSQRLRYTVLWDLFLSSGGKGGNSIGPVIICGEKLALLTAPVKYVPSCLFTSREKDIQFSKHCSQCQTMRPKPVFSKHIWEKISTLKWYFSILYNEEL